MKKSLIALAVMAAAGAASAQSSVTLFGIVDAAITHGSASNGGSSWTGITNSGYNSSRLGFRGTEDLGGGMAASFWLEAGVNNDDGSGQTLSTNNHAAATGGGGLTFNRRSTVSLSGGWGELRLGRDYTPMFWNLTIFDPFGTNGVGTNVMLSGLGLMANTNAVANGFATGTQAATVAVRASNQIGYFLPANLGGFYGQAGYWFGENAQNGAAAQHDGDGYGVRAGYASGPFNVAADWGRTKYSTGDFKTWNVAGQWDFGMARVMAQYDRDTIAASAGAPELDGRGWLVGGLIPVGAGEIRLAYSRYTVDANAGANPRASKWALGYDHNLSKRTNVYATIARVSNSNGAAISLGNSVASVGGIANGYSSTGFDIGVRHSF